MELILRPANMIKKSFHLLNPISCPANTEKESSMFLIEFYVQNKVSWPYSSFQAKRLTVVITN
jgi:hypothetical protein